VEAGVAGLAALLVLLTRTQIGVMVAFLVAAGGVGAVLLYEYVDVGAVGRCRTCTNPSATPRRPTA
jgi:hypothetical protein